MEQYRVYILDAEGHVNDPPEVIECPDDGAAIEQARQLLDGRHRGLEPLPSCHLSRPGAAEQAPIVG
jgi:hypothetical protein